MQYQHVFILAPHKSLCYRQVLATVMTDTRHRVMAVYSVLWFQHWRKRSPLRSPSNCVLKAKY